MDVTNATLSSYKTQVPLESIRKSHFCSDQKPTLQLALNGTRGDARSMCGKHLMCLIDRRKILDMHEQSGHTASIYISIILACYALGMIILLIHYIKQKYGQVSKKITKLNIWGVQPVKGVILQSESNLYRQTLIQPISF